MHRRDSRGKEFCGKWTGFLVADEQSNARQKRQSKSSPINSRPSQSVPKTGQRSLSHMSPFGKFSYPSLISRGQETFD